jgi:hypothetical protein
MKNKFFILAITVLIGFVFSASAEPIKTIQVGNRTYSIPTSIKLIQLPNGRYEIDKEGILDHRVGNGGDYIRSTFIHLGEKVMQFLETTDEGHALVEQNTLNVVSLKETLSTKQIVLTNDILIDNTGSVVDAIGLPGLIILNATNWLDHFENDRNVYHLIFHEMLRSAAVNDDDFVISKAIMNFPTSLRLSTRLLPLIPMLDEDSIQSLVTLEKISVGGTGCPKGSTYTDLDLTRNVIDITLKNFVAINNESRTIDYKACNMMIPLQLPKGKRLVISLIDLTGIVRPENVNLTSKNTLRFEAFMAGSQGKVNSKIIQLGSSARTVLFRKTDVLTTGCGTSEILRLNANNTLQSKKLNSEIIEERNNVAQVKKMTVYLTLESCD